ncbi:peptidoglycan editing factor PgeF [Photobacterium satsumensis]|uniref:peptidoglycan editing factor PgeF n=1 Tax=Photobacterium satsumensis TaxID=2910239 RepID=UPI003D0DCF00
MWIVPDWPAPANVKAIATTREGGNSIGPYQGLNLGNHVGDEPEVVRQNRQWLQHQLGLTTVPVWLNQTHSIDVISIEQAQSKAIDADGSYTAKPLLPCVVMTADCLPVILCDRQGTQVAAVHAGWRGLVDGIIEQAVAKFSVPGSELMAWLGPAIGPQAFEVGGEVREQFLAHDPAAVEAFQPYGEKWLADLYQLARQRLASVSVDNVSGGDCCTYSEAERFYSYRRDGVTGRQATLIWLE